MKLDVESSNFVNYPSEGYVNLHLDDGNTATIHEPYPSGLHSLLTEAEISAVISSLTSNVDSSWGATSLGFSSANHTPLNVISHEQQKEKPPKKIQDYLLGPVVGEGTYGKVREAVKITNFKRVAIKILKKGKLKKMKGGLKAIETEIMIMRQLRGNNNCILQLREVIRGKDSISIVMDLAIGSLENLLDCQYHRKLAEGVAQTFFHQMLLGLEFMHSKSVVHKDIKPSNIMVMPDGTANIADFGVAEVLSIYDGVPHCARTHGSPAFQCPQIASGKELFNGFKSDVWSAGVTLYIILTGRLPFSGKGLYNLYEAICLEDFSDEGLSEECATLLSGMLDKDEDSRFAVDDILRFPWTWQENRVSANRCVIWCPESAHYAKQFSPFHNILQNIVVPSGGIPKPCSVDELLPSLSGFSMIYASVGENERKQSLYDVDAVAAHFITRNHSLNDCHPEANARFNFRKPQSENESLFCELGLAEKGFFCSGMPLAPNAPGRSISTFASESGAACSSNSTAPGSFYGSIKRQKEQYFTSYNKHMDETGQKGDEQTIYRKVDDKAARELQMRTYMENGGCIHFSREQHLQAAEHKGQGIILRLCPESYTRMRQHHLSYIQNAVHHGIDANNTIRNDVDGSNQKCNNIMSDDNACKVM